MTHHNITEEELVADVKAIEEDIKSRTSDLKIAREALIERKKSDIVSALAQKPEPFGAVSQQIGEDKVTFTTPKKVDWDQEGLATLYNQISSDPEENVSDYITVEYKVKEDAYKNWPSNLRETFEPYRTVTPGNVAVKIEPAKAK